MPPSISIPLSVLDLVPVRTGEGPPQALQHTRQLAQHADRLGYRRYWMAEHHNMVGIASAATSVVIGYVAGATQRIRVGAGGIMLPNHAPLVIAEQFGTLASLYPDRIDLGLGRAPGTDQLTLRALRRGPESADRFADDVLELQAYLAPVHEAQRIQAVPGAGTEVPLWILGSSLYGAHLAAALGLPYAFASHFAPDQLYEAIDVYRNRFQPSPQLKQPHLMLGVTVVAADSDSEAKRLFTTVQQQFTNLVRNNRGRMQAPIDDIETYWTPMEKAHVTRMLACSFHGSATTVGEQVADFVQRTGADELMVTGPIYDPAARLRSYELMAEIGLMTRVP